MMIETTRLRIVPLTVEQFRLLLFGTDKMEQALGLMPSNTYLDEHTQQAMEELFQKLLEYHEKYFWYTSWQIILKSENKAIASACFMEEPNENGIVEIGYGTNEAYRNKGYMTEAVKAMCEWAFKQPKVKTVIAETEKDNYASHKILQRCGMKLYSAIDNSLWWKLEKIAKSIVMQHIEYKAQKDFSVDELKELFLSVEWYLGKYPEKLVVAMKNSSTVFSAWDDDKLIGLISALDDGATTVYIPNLLVNSAYQGKGIGKTLLKMMTEHYKGYLGIGLIADKEKASFYEHCKFKVEEKQVPIFLITPYE